MADVPDYIPPNNNRIEDFLYWNPPSGFPDDNIFISCEFEAGCYEDWGFTVWKLHWIKDDLYRRERIASGKLTECLAKARKYLSERLDNADKKE